MTINYFFKIAEHILLVKSPVDVVLMDFLPSFRDFLIDDPESSPILEVELVFDQPLDITCERKVLTDTSIVWGDGFLFEETKDNYITTLGNELMQVKLEMVSTKEFAKSTIYLKRSDVSNLYSLSWFIMVAYGQAVLPYKTVMIHASTVERDEKEAYAFLGVSGTGKSTHSQLWLKYLSGFTLLNDDNPAIRIFDNKKVYIYGTPWSGKTKCYRNLKVELKGFVRLRQANVNQFNLKADTESFILLLPSCTAIRWNRKLFNYMIDSLEEVIKIIPIGTMDCLISEEAAKVCYKGIVNN